MPKSKGGYVPTPDEIRKAEGNPYLSDADAMQHHMDGRVTLADIEHKKEKDNLIAQNIRLLNRPIDPIPQRVGIFSLDPYPALSRYYEKQEIKRAVLDELEQSRTPRKKPPKPKRSTVQKSHKKPHKKIQAKPQAKTRTRSRSRSQSNSRSKK